jgi:hypothetical protein
MRPRFERNNFAVLNQACPDVCATKVNANQVCFFCCMHEILHQFPRNKSSFWTFKVQRKIKDRMKYLFRNATWFGLNSGRIIRK